MSNFNYFADHKSWMISKQTAYIFLKFQKENFFINTLTSKLTNVNIIPHFETAEMFLLILLIIWFPLKNAHSQQFF